mgnify:FL=1
MKVENFHQRILRCSAEQASILIDSFADVNSPLWPHKYWPRERFDSLLGIGAIGSHGGTVYVVEQYEPGRVISFRFIKPKGYIGTHRFEIIKVDSSSSQLIHLFQCELQGFDYLFWNLVIQWVHDALIEDAFDSAEIHLFPTSVIPSKWPLRVYFFRHMLGLTRLIFGRRNYLSKKQQEELSYE